MKRRLPIPRLIAGALLLLAIATAYTQRDHLDPATLKTLVASAGPAASLVYILLYALATVLFVPGTVFGLLGGALFGPAWGIAWNLAGATLGAALAFLLSRSLLGDWVARRSGERLRPLMDGVAREGWHFVAFTRLVPIFPFNLLNYALGATSIRFLPYLLASALCMLPGTAAYTYLDYLGREAAGGAEGLAQKGLIGLALLAIALLLPRLLRHLRRPQLQWQDIDSLHAQLATDGPLLLDVRSAEEFEGPLGHIPGARNLPLPDLGQELQQLQDWKDKPVVTVCLADRRSTEAARLLQAAGWQQVRVLRGGMKAWRGQEP